MILFGCALGAIVGFAVFSIFGHAMEYGRNAGIIQTNTSNGKDTERR